MSRPSRRTIVAGAMLATAGTAIAQDQKSVPNPVEGKQGAPMLGPHNLPREAENPDLLQPPRRITDGPEPAVLVR